MAPETTGDATARLEQLLAIGTALSAEKNIDKLLEGILLGAMDLTHAEGGTLYTVTPDKQLKFELLRNRRLDIAMGGTTGKAVPYESLPLYDESGHANLNMVAAQAVLRDTTINIPDVYQAQDYDFAGTRAFDEQTGYRSRSFLTVPLKDHENEIIGVLQLINAVDPATGEVGEFHADAQRLTESLASQAAISLTNQRLIAEQKKLFESFIKLIASAIDEKSPYTGGHCERVPDLTMMLARAAAARDYGGMQDFAPGDEEFYELKIAAWLHDCGKVTTPEHVVDKATKLQTIFDRIDLIDTRFGALKRERIIQALRARLLRHGIDAAPDERLQAELARLDEDAAFLRRANQGGEHMRAEDQQRVRDIAAYPWTDEQGAQCGFLSENEVYNLCIAKGTLTPEERDIINNHIVMTIRMLEALPYPRNLRNVPEFAGGHHERMDGKGYPRGLTRDQMSVQARIMGIADIFEALTAADRPYKEGKTLSEALDILGKMKLDNHIDPDLFDLFIRENIYLDYARRFLDPKQIDDVDVTRIPGYVP